MIENLPITVTEASLAKTAARLGALVGDIELVPNVGGGFDAVLHFIKQKDADAAITTELAEAFATASAPVVFKRYVPPKLRPPGSLTIGPEAVVSSDLRFNPVYAHHHEGEVEYETVQQHISDDNNNDDDNDDDGLYFDPQMVGPSASSDFEPAEVGKPESIYDGLPQQFMLSSIEEEGMTRHGTLQHRRIEKASSLYTMLPTFWIRKAGRRMNPRTRSPGLPVPISILGSGMRAPTLALGVKAPTPRLGAKASTLGLAMISEVKKPTPAALTLTLSTAALRARTSTAMPS